MVQSFWEQPWEEIERALQKNRGKCIQTQGMRGKSAGLAPTLAAIAATDRLIVYRLYGLTDEEIDLVEGA